MSDRVALKAAVDLLNVPTQVRLTRAAPLPDGVLILLRIAAGDEASEQTAAALMDRSQEFMRKASMFFIEQILFAPEADCYRVLGSAPNASAAELRRNVALLLRWLHPDLDPRGERSVFTGRVTTAWNNLKTPERRAAYDAMLMRQVEKGQNGQHKEGKSGHRRHAAHNSPGHARKQRVRSATMTEHGRGTVKVGFLRRALAAFLHRPLP